MDKTLTSNNLDVNIKRVIFYLFFSLIDNSVNDSQVNQFSVR